MNLASPSLLTVSAEVHPAIAIREHQCQQAESSTTQEEVLAPRGLRARK